MQIDKTENIFAKVDAEWFFSPASTNIADFANGMVNKLVQLDCNLSLLQIVSHHLAKAKDDGVPRKGIYKVKLVQDAEVANEQQLSNEENGNRNKKKNPHSKDELLKEIKNSFVKIKVKQQMYLGRKANVIFISDVTKKVNARVQEV